LHLRFSLGAETFGGASVARRLLRKSHPQPLTSASSLASTSENIFAGRSSCTTARSCSPRRHRAATAHWLDAGRRARCPLEIGGHFRLDDCRRVKLFEIGPGGHPAPHPRDQTAGPAVSRSCRSFSVALQKVLSISAIRADS
jgi:hypothetical protein